MATRIAISKPRISASDNRRVKLPPKQVAAVYSTPEHKAWALAVKRRAGWRCQAPGCTVGHPERLYADHIVELRDGGHPTDPANGQALCASHHSTKTLSQRAVRSRSTAD